MCFSSRRLVYMSMDDLSYDHQAMTTPGSHVHSRPGEAAVSSAELLAGGTLPARWVRAWNRDLDAPVLWSAAEGWVTAEQLQLRSAAVAGRLAAAGIRAGDRVLVSAANSIELVVAHIACMRAGFVVVPANTAYRSEELGHLLKDSEPVAAILDDPERAGWCQAARSSLIVLQPSVEGPDSPPPPLDAAGLAAPALIGYTSGTTGQPKGAVLTHGNLASSVAALERAWRWTIADRLVLCLPLFHIHGLGVGLHGTLAVGGSAVLLERFDVDVVLNAARQQSATLFFGVPTMYSRLVESPRAAELSRFRLCVSGSAPLPADLHQRLEQVSGQRVLERYGMTETLMLVSNPYDGERRAGTVGFALPGVDLRLSADGRNEVEVRGPNVFSGYRNRPEANAEAFTSDGYFRTGDLGALDEDGYLTLVGRAKELIISGGFNIYPREIEDVLRLHPAVVDAAVIGVADVEWGEAVTAYCEVKEPVLPEELRTWVAERLARFKRPQTVHFVEALPRNALGKVQKHLLG